MTVSSGEGGNRGSEDLTPPAEGFERLYERVEPRKLTPRDDTPSRH